MTGGYITPAPNFSQQQVKENEPRINRRIKMREVRVIADDGTQLGVLPIEQAIRLAEEKGLDLVEVQPNVRPPVCKILDYGKFKYQQKRKMAEQKSAQKVVDVKEVKFRPQTAQHDFETKIKHIKGFLAEGHRVKITVMFRGRELAHPEIGKEMLLRITGELSGLAQLDGDPKMEGKALFALFSTNKPQSKNHIKPDVSYIKK